ncbi:MAG: hypothetical protein M5T61_20860, partial [Acidimicrobiia bacterium]|nr:hypothetical protein [Acidimicrobiia bacterium]
MIEWARTTGAFVIEDDYDGEFRYDGGAIGPLQGLDPTAVIHAGTASKTLAAGLRLGWLALPGSIHPLISREKQLADWHSGARDQVAFAESLRSTGYDRHIRKLRLRYRKPSRQVGRDTEGVQAGRRDRRYRQQVLNLLIPLPDSGGRTGGPDRGGSGRRRPWEGSPETAYYEGTARWPDRRLAPPPPSTHSEARSTRCGRHLEPRPLSPGRATEL